MAPKLPGRSVLRASQVTQKPRMCLSMCDKSNENPVLHPKSWCLVMTSEAYLTPGTPAAHLG